MNEQNKKLLECAEFIKENCENRDFCDGCIFNKLEIERDEYTNEPINYYRFCELERKTYPCNWHFEDVITICDYCEFKNNQSARCLDCPAKLKGNKEKTENENNIFYPDDVKNCWIGRETLLKIRCEIEHLHEWAFKRDEILKIIDKYIDESEV